MSDAKKSVGLTPRGLAVCDFAFRDGPALGLTAEEAYATAERLIEKWDGTETLLRLYQRTELWPNTVADDNCEKRRTLKMPTVQEIDNELKANEDQINQAKAQLQQLKDKRNELKQMRGQAQAETNKEPTDAQPQ